jgi:NADH-quinone oxidoreductase subunit L
MVTAGVYLVIRANVLFQAAPVVSVAVACIGLLTALVAASIALVQDDLKKVLAYSTVSQLGFMFIAVGVGAYAAGLFHLMTHAFFKALLFLGAGSVSHALAGELDMRKMGGLAKALPQTRTVMLVATLAIAGIVPLSGFWSKDEILAGVLTSVLPPALRWTLWIAALGGALMTAFYMFRLYFRTFAGEKRWVAGAHPHESPRTMMLPLWILAGLSAFGGALGLAAWTGLPSFMHHALEPVIYPGSMIAGRTHADAGTEIVLALIATAVAVAGILLARAWYARQSDAPARMASAWPGLRSHLRGKWWIDEALGAAIIQPAIRLSRLAGDFDRKVIDVAVESSGLGAALAGEMLRGVTSGRVRTYALAVLVGAVGLVSWLVLK